MIFLQNMSWQSIYGFVPKSHQLIRTWPVNLSPSACHSAPHTSGKYIIIYCMIQYVFTTEQLLNWLYCPLNKFLTHTQFVIHLKFSGYAWFIQSYSHDILQGLTALKGALSISLFPVRWENLAFLFHKRFIYLLFLPRFAYQAYGFWAKKVNGIWSVKKDPHHKEQKLQYHLTAAWKSCKSDFYNSSADLPH